jgi:hypothetical protein
MRYSLCFLILIIFSIQSACAQSRSNISFGYGLTKPYSSNYNFGSGVFLQGDIPVSNKLAITPDIGYNRLNSKTADQFNPILSPIANINLYHLGLSLKYNFDRNFFAAAGPMFYMAQGGEDTAGIGVGGSGEVGYNLNVDKHNTFAFSFNTSIVNITSYGLGVTSIACLKVAYVINFKGY